MEREGNRKTGCIKRHEHLDRRYVDIRFPAESDDKSRYLIIAAVLCLDLLCGEEVFTTEQLGQ